MLLKILEVEIVYNDNNIPASVKCVYLASRHYKAFT